MANLSEAFEDHLRSLSDQEWNALASRVRQPQQTTPTAPLPGERQFDKDPIGSLKNPGFDEAVRRGYIDKDGNPAGKATR
ncbi:hypothetical protein [Mycolicibacterium mengxianglii]|uniref:hypothetical protein n=1 Tax=Mycolicibacterium mengxianglii TaxID=2736649 RepID=UPI0018D0D8C5|nr:hypothetical protein [Mycolicibacterium mengxianglii]